MMDTEDRKRVLVPQTVVNTVLEEGATEFTWDGETIVLTEDDIPQEDPNDCCFRSANMMDGSSLDKQVCNKCGRVFDLHGSLERFDSSFADDKIVALVPRKEFLTE